ncbi:unnamed protein product [Euphydryas editha]|uniref:Histone-lysine N-methyltransferase SETMAR n=1 Tax=Euphydryas editha TaxID=104508 RepID=A0AAU9TPA4_EUPED|nr:unnamed protein product [Euphydryas editha]
MAKLHELSFELLPHPPYSPDLAPSDIFLFSDLKRKLLAGKKFKDDEEQRPILRLNTLSIEKLEDRYNRCIALDSNYVEK